MLSVVHKLAGGVAGLSAAGLIGLIADESARPGRLAIPILAVVLALAAIAWYFTRPPTQPTGATVTADRGGRAEAVIDSPAGRDIHVGDRITYNPPPGISRGRSERLRAVKDELGHLQRRFAQFDAHFEEWGTIRPLTGQPYQRLPAEKWNLYGVGLNLSQPDHDLVQEAYELANDFNHEMERPPVTFGGWFEPDLGGLRDAVEEALAVIEAEISRAGGIEQSSYARAAQLQQEWHDRELVAALLHVRQELVTSQRRLRRVLQHGSTEGFRGFPSAQWTKHEDRIRRAAPAVCRLAAEAYGLVIEMREAGFEDEQRRLTDEEVELAQEGLGLMEQTVAAIDEGSAQ